MSVKVIENQSKEIKNLTKKLNDLKNNEETIQSLKNDINNKDEELKKLRNELQNNNSNSDFNNLINNGGKMMCLNFGSKDGKINFAIPCFSTNIFAEIEEKLYQEYPEYRETNNNFLINDVEILRFKTIEQNNIKSGKPITLIKPQ